ncbi:putative LOG family protein [Dioscorea sansibarensis]
MLRLILLKNWSVLKNINLVYGGGSLGLMGLFSQAMFNGGRHVLGYGFLIIGVTVEEVKQVVDMHQRKVEMARHSDAFIALPVGLLNIDGYYNSLLLFIDQAIEEGFIKLSARHIIVSGSNAKKLFKKLSNVYKEYFACHERVAPKLNWECKQLEHSQINEIST